MQSRPYPAVTQVRALLQCLSRRPVGTVRDGVFWSIICQELSVFSDRHQRFLVRYVRPMVSALGLLPVRAVLHPSLQGG